MSRLNEININSKGEVFAIKNYRSATDVDIIFKTDNSVKNVTYAQFKSGHVKRNDDNSTWIGEPAEDKYGNECVIVDYNGDNNITVQYEDGDVVYGLTMDDIINCTFDKTGPRPMASDKKSLENIDIERRHTYEDIMYLLDRHGKGVMIRPCGFGKTMIGLSLFFRPRYHKCLFLHPLDDDTNARKIRDSRSKKKIDTRTYAWLYSRNKEQIEKLDYDIVFCDEIHRVGGDEDGNGAYHTYQALKYLMETHPNTHFVGATATPLRMDGIDVIHTLFHDHTCYPYTLEDMFESKLLKSPNYFYCVYDVVKKVQNELEKNKIVNMQMDKEKLQDLLKFSGEDIDNIDSRFMDKHIKECCDKILPDTKYMRFIAFYLTNEDIKNNKDKVLNWFKKAYPKHQVESITVTSSSEHSLRDIESLPTEPTEPGFEGRIDIIFNCEMLCMGYHSELITGLVLDRKTKSLAKYMQMIGRLLSCEKKDPVIIFDIVDNIHSEFVCKLDTSSVMPVKPDFDYVPNTFDEVVVANEARDWSKIRKTCKKARATEKLMHDNAILEGKADEVIVDNPVVENFHENTKKVSDKSKQAIKEVWDYVKVNKNLDFATACQKLAHVEKRYGTLDLCDSKPEEADILKHVSAKEKAMANLGTYMDKESVSITSEKVNNIPEEALGYNATYYYNYNTNEMISKNINVLNKRANFVEDLKALTATALKASYDSVVDKYHELIETNNLDKDKYTEYTGFEEIDKKSERYSLLRSVSEFLFGIPVGKVISYMITGNVEVV